MTTIDPVTFEVIASGLQSAAEEMGAVLKRSSYSPIIRDMDDFSCAMFSAEGDLFAQADYIPAQLGAMSLVVRSILQEWSDELSDGDVFLCNHPYRGAMHLPDVNVVAPVFRDGRLIAWAGTAAHHIDVGGVNPGSEGPELQDLFAEGLIMPPVRLCIAGRESRDVVALVSSNIRDPLSTVSDLRAQRAACDLGRQRLLELIDAYTWPVTSTVITRMLDQSEAAVRHALTSLPDGYAEAEGFLDDDGRGGPPTRIHVAVRKVHDQLTVDLSGSASQVAGAMNVPWASTRAGVVYAVRSMLGVEVGANDGLMRAVEIRCPQGSVLNPHPPAAVSVRHNTCQRLADTLIRALGELWPERAVASSTVAFFCVNLESTSPVTGRPSVMVDVMGGGTGATAFGDGVDGVDTYMSNVGLMPVEVAETNYRVRVLRTELIPESRGIGRHSGGMGLRRDYEVLEDQARATFYSEQTDSRFAPQGRAGGGAGAPTRITLIDADGMQCPAPTKASMVLHAGTILRVETSGGGGYGDPATPESATPTSAESSASESTGGAA